MNVDSRAPVLRARELEVRYRMRSLATPFDGRLDEARGVMMLAEQILDGTTSDVAIVLHMTKRLRLLGVHRPPLLRDAGMTVAAVLRAALLSDAASVIYVHRRVTDGWADDDDSALVGRLRRAGRMFGVELRDALSIWSTPHELTYYSFRNDLAL